MRLLACFAKKPVILDPPAPGTEHPAQEAPPPRAHTAVFTPTSIPELHPEYAHAEPYCFVARTESARLIVDKLRGARGQPPQDPLQTFKDSGLVVVRGPSHTAPLPPVSTSTRPRSDGHAAALLASLPSAANTSHSPSATIPDGPDDLLSSTPAPVNGLSVDLTQPLTSTVDEITPVLPTPIPVPVSVPAAPRSSVPLQVETPTTCDASFAESDDSVPPPTDENVSDVANTVSPRASGALGRKPRRKAASGRRAVGTTTDSMSSLASTATAGGTTRRKSGLRPPLSPSPRKNSKLFVKSGRKVVAASAERVGGKARARRADVANTANKSDSAESQSGRDSNVPDGGSVQGAAMVSADRPPQMGTPPSLDLSADKSPDDDDEVDALMEKHMDNTPKELLAPIVVPRTSAVFGELPYLPTTERPPAPSFGLATEAASTSMLPKGIPTDSSGNTDLSARFADVDGDFSSGLLALSVNSPARKLMARANALPPIPSLDEADDDILPSLDGPVAMSNPSGSSGASSSSSTTSGLRAKRKSKPFLLPDMVGGSVPGALASNDALALPPAPDAPPMPVPPHSQDAKDDAANLFPIPLTPSKLTAARQRIEHGDPHDLPPPPRTSAHVPTSIMRRASASRRKTVNFSDAAPVIIEPNLRAPSQSVPRSAVLARESGVEAEVPESLVSALSFTRDSVFGGGSSGMPSVSTEAFADAEADVTTLSSAAAYKMTGMTMDGSNSKPMATSLKALTSAKTPKFVASVPEMTTERRNDMNVMNGASSQMGKTSTAIVAQPGVVTLAQTSRAHSDTSETSSMSTTLTGAVESRASSDASSSFQDLSSRRMSRRVSAKDKAAINAARNRQSQAVARAMVEQIRGVPKSAMLAFSEHEVVIDKEEDGAMSVGGISEDTTESEMSSARDLNLNVRRSVRGSMRASRTVRVPKIVPGVIPAPPPPPPFAPEVSRVRSVRSPPPPPPPSMMMAGKK